MPWLTSISRSADASFLWVAHIVVVLAGAGLVAVLTPVPLWTEFFAAGTRESGLALAAAVNRVAGGFIVAVALMGAVGTKGTW